MKIASSSVYHSTTQMVTLHASMPHKLPTTLLGALSQGLKVVPVPSTPSIGEQFTLATRGVVEVPGKGCPARTSDWSCHTAVCAQEES